MPILFWTYSARFCRATSNISYPRTLISFVWCCSLQKRMLLHYLYLSVFLVGCVQVLSGYILLGWQFAHYEIFRLFLLPRRMQRRGAGSGIRQGQVRVELVDVCGVLMRSSPQFYYVLLALLDRRHRSQCGGAWWRHEIGWWHLGKWPHSREVYNNVWVYLLLVWLAQWRLCLKLARVCNQ